jgi:hypothetical protein
MAIDERRVLSDEDITTTSVRQGVRPGIRHGAVSMADKDQGDADGTDKGDADGTDRADRGDQTDATDRGDQTDRADRGDTDGTDR